MFSAPGLTPPVGSPIGKSTPVTLGLFLMLASVFFFAGMGWQRLHTSEEAGHKRDIAIERLSELAADNKARLDLLESEIRRPRPVH